MAQALLPEVPTQGEHGSHRDVRARTPVVLSLHAPDPDTGLPTTWHVAPLTADGATGAYLVERADGEIHSPAVWMQARREAHMAHEADVLALVRRLLFGEAAGQDR